MSDLNRAQGIVATYMDAIVRLFKPGAKITVIVRTPDKPDADFLMTSEPSLEDVKALLDRRIAAGQDKGRFEVRPEDRP